MPTACTWALCPAVNVPRGLPHHARQRRRRRQTGRSKEGGVWSGVDVRWLPCFCEAGPEGGVRRPRARSMQTQAGQMQAAL